LTFVADRPSGVRQRPHPRHVPTNLNAGTSFVIHWRGDRTNLEDQVFQALTSPITSGQPDEKAVIDRLSRIPGYAPLFQVAFPNEPPNRCWADIAADLVGPDVKFHRRQAQLHPCFTDDASCGLANGNLAGNLDLAGEYSPPSARTGHCVCGRILPTTKTVG
jgi:hypothetical protein